MATVHPAPAPISSARVDAEWVAERHSQAEKILDAARHLLADVQSVDYRVVASSSAAHGLHDIAEDAGASLIVVGSSSRAAEHRLLAGSTADRLLAGSQVPVAVAPRGIRDRTSGGCGAWASPTSTLRTGTPRWISRCEWLHASAGP